jgi:hypothetical protein
LLSRAPLDISTEITKTARSAINKAKNRAESGFNRKKLLSGIKSGQVNERSPRVDPINIGSQESIEAIVLVFLT